MSHSNNCPALDVLTDEQLAAIQGGDAASALAEAARQVAQQKASGWPIINPIIAPPITLRFDVGPEYEPPTDPNDPRNIVFPE